MMMEEFSDVLGYCGGSFMMSNFGVILQCGECVKNSLNISEKKS
jgi:hypothetical protein